MLVTSTEQNRASKRSVAVPASKFKRRRYELNSDEKRAPKRQSLAREFRSRTAANVTYQ